MQRALWAAIARAMAVGDGSEARRLLLLLRSAN
jgi:hypothetical protein